MNRIPRKNVYGTIIVLVVAGGTVYWMTAGRSERTLLRAADSATAGGEKESGKPVSVETAAPQRRPLTRVLTMPGTLQAYETADLFGKISGYVAAVNVDIGDRVAKDDVLMTIDVPEMTDELRRAEAVLLARQSQVAQAKSMIDTANAEVVRCAVEQELKKITWQRREQLRRQNAIPEQELDEARIAHEVSQAQCRIAEAKVAAAEADLSVAEAETRVAEATVARTRTLMNYVTIRAPFEGTITERWVDAGAFVRSASDGATTPVLRIAAVDRLRLVLDIPESDASDVESGAPVEIAIGPAGAPPVRSAITRRSGAISPDTRTMRMEVDLDNRDGKLAPGMYARVAVTLETKVQALMIPSKAVRVRGRDLSVLVARNGFAESLPIELGYDDGRWAEVAKGLSGDERVVVAANSVLVPGARIVE